MLSPKPSFVRKILDIIPLSNKIIWCISGLGLILLAMSLTLSVRSPFPYFYFFSDESTYYTMTQSLAYDFDLYYTVEDLERVCQEWADGPTGIFLKKTESGLITFGKSFLYPLIAALPVKVFGSNGFFLVNFFCFWLLVTLGTIHLTKTQDHFTAFLFAFIFFFFSTTWVFMFWIHPEIVLMCLVMISLYAWFLGPFDQVKYEQLRLFIMASCLAMATFGKITNAIFVGPISFDMFLYRLHLRSEKDKFDWFQMRKNILKVTVFLFLFCLLLYMFFGLNKVYTGDWNYQWGERKGFARQFPFEDETQTFDTIGSPATRHDLTVKLDPLLLLRNCVYFVFGRFGGLIAYFFPALVALFLFSQGEKSIRQYLLLIAVVGQQLFYFIFLTDNYLGGMGTIGNRYFLNVFPLFIFLINRKIPRYILLVIVVVGSFFLMSINMNPFAQSYQPAEHTFIFPYSLLPVELTQVDFLPVHINHHLSRRAYEGPPPYRLTFLDYQTYLPEQDGFWLRPGKSAQLLLETKSSATSMKFFLANGARENRIIIKIDHSHQEMLLAPRERQEISIPLRAAYIHNDWLIHKISCYAENGFIPRFHESGSTDRRYLGCFVSMQLIEQ